MILVDAMYINNSGGKVLLDYLIEEIEKSNLEVFYLFDKRIVQNHSRIRGNRFLYIKASLFRRHLFYLKNKNNFRKVLCFGNLPPNVKINSTVFTYFHQPLFLEIPSEFNVILKIIYTIKTMLLQYLKNNTSFWLVQSDMIKEKLLLKLKLNNLGRIKILPFYPSIISEVSIVRIKNRFLYVSNGPPHKNHIRLLNAFEKFYDKNSIGELHLTVSSQFEEIISKIERLVEKGYKIINHGFIDRQELFNLYQSSEFCIYPSLAESFGLGIIESLENGCKIIGADRPYMHTICEPSLVFNPENVEDISLAFEKSVNENIKLSKQLVYNQINDLIMLLEE